MTILTDWAALSAAADSLHTAIEAEKDPVNNTAIETEGYTNLGIAIQSIREILAEEAATRGVNELTMQP
jgi:hypothetical protein